MKTKLLKLDVKAFEDKKVAWLIVLNLTLSLFQFAYITIRFKYLNPQIPLWYTKFWGDPQLAQGFYLFVIPAICLFFTLLSVPIINKFYLLKSREVVFTTLTLLTISVSFLLISAMRIISKGSSPFPAFIDQRIPGLLFLLFLSFLVCYLIVPAVIKHAKKYNVITDPALHTHPGMILKKPSARLGAVAFFLAFFIVALIFTPHTREVLGLYIGALLTTLIGVLDDKKSLNPYFRLLFLLPLAIIITMVVSDLHIYYFANPFAGITRLDFIQYSINLWGLKFSILPVADVFTIVWIMWVMNMLSWSNAVDGQFSGMTAITCIITALLALRLTSINPQQIYVAQLSAIAGGAALGILPYNWHPSKIMWGFGATTMGLVIAILSVMAGAKVAVATLVLIVPTLDAVITIIRRVVQKKSPVWGDRGHFHHRLLDIGYSQPQVAVFYWIITAFFGGVALLSSGKSKFLALLTLGGIVAFILVTMNLRGALNKTQSQPVEK